MPETLRQALDRLGAKDGHTKVAVILAAQEARKRAERPRLYWIRD